MKGKTGLSEKLKNEEIFLAIPILLFFISPIVRLVANIIAYARQGFVKIGYTLSIEYTNTILAVITVSLFSVLYYFDLGFKKNKPRFEREIVKKAIKRDLPLVLFAVYFVWMILCTCVNGFTDLSINGDYYRGEGFYYYFACIFIFFTSAMFLQNEKIRDILIRILLDSSVILGILAFADFFFGPFYIFSPYNQKESLSSVFYNSNYYGYYLTIVILISTGLYLKSVSKKTEKFYLGFFIFNTSVLIINLTRGGYIAVLFTLLGTVFFMKKYGSRFRKKAVLLLVIFLIETFVFSFICDTLISQLLQIVFDVLNIMRNPKGADDAGSERWLLWKCTFKLIKERPLFGYGNEGIHRFLPMLSETHKTRPHNEYLQIAAFWGLPGLFIYLASTLTVIIRTYKIYDRLTPVSFACLLASIGYMGSSFFGNSMCFTTPFFYIMMGMAYSEWRKINKKAST